jgi:hypothetical protein
MCSILIENIKVIQLDKKLTNSMEPEISLPSSEIPITIPHLEPLESSPRTVYLRGVLILSFYL